MLKKSASFVLASLRGSTYRSVRLASSLTAALLNGFFEYPSWHSPVALDVQINDILHAHIVFPKPVNNYSPVC